MINVDTLTAEVNLPIYKLRYYVPNILNMVNDYRRNNPISVNSNSHLSSWRSDWQTHKKDSRFNILIDFTIQALESFHLELFHSKQKFGCSEMWIAQYDKGDHAERHYHYPLDWSAVYYINVEKNTSPIIFGEDVRVQPEDNMMLIFPGWLNHRVPKTKGKRTLIAMNFNKL